MATDYYALLDLKPGATADQVEAAFKRKMAQLHERRAPQYELDQVLDAYTVLKQNPGQAKAAAKALKKAGKENQTAKTYAQLLNFDWDKVTDPDLPETASQKKAFRDEIWFKVLIISVALAVFAFIFFLSSKI